MRHPLVPHEFFASPLLSSMKSQTILGLFLTIFGIIALAYHEINYTTTEKAIDLGPLQVTAEKTHTVPLPPIVGGIAMAGGILLMLSSYRKV